MSRLTLTEVISNAFSKLAGTEPDFEVSVERPATPEFGDWSSNVAMVAAKNLGKSPLDLANELAEILNQDCLAHIERVEVAPPGFLNFHLKNDWLYEVVEEILNLGEENFCRSNLGEGQKVIVEFVSANPTGPLHAGHAKGAVMGDSLARVLERSGYAVAKENYLNDLGSQMGLFVKSLSARLNKEELPEDGYMGSYISDWAEEYKNDSNNQELEEWGINKALSEQREVLSQLGIEFDIWFNESSLQDDGRVEKTLQELEKKSMVYEEEGAKWLKTSDYGDDKNRVLVKSDGQATYLLPDIAYHQDKFSRAERLINIWGADHHGYVGRLKAALQALGLDSEKLTIIISQLVRLESQGEELKISKRTGDIILLSDLLEMLGVDAVRFTFLLHSPDSTQTIDLEKATAQSMDNPVYYVQYAHTRICSIFQKLEVSDNPPDLTLLTHPRELELIRVLAEMSDLVERVAMELTPHRLTGYLSELAGAFHSFYHECRVMGEGISPELTQARVRLLKAVQIGLRVGLNLCGVSAPQEM